MSFRPTKSQQRYLSVDLNVCKEICPDWLLVFLELLRQQKIQGLSSGDKIEMRKPIWDAAGGCHAGPAQKDYEPSGADIAMGYRSF